MDLARDLQSKGHYRNYSCPIIKASCKSSIDKTSDISISSTQIERLRKRKLKSIELCEIQPETVAKVVKSYLLPMIKYKCSSKFENTSLVSHFTVIENLQNENEHLNTLLNELRERDKLLAQERYEYLEEVNRLNNLNIDYQTHIKFLNNTFTQTIKNTRRVEKQLEFSKYHKTRAQINVEEYDKKFKFILEELQIQRDLNNIRFFLSIFL